MARPEKEPETDLGKRLRSLRNALSSLEAKQVAKAVGVSQSTLYTYERGEKEPTASTLAAYATCFGVNPNWLLTGNGEMFADASAVPSAPGFHTINPEVFRAVGRLVTRLHKAEGITLPPDALFDEQSSAYNTLIEKAENPSDTDELTSLLPWLEARLKRQLSSAKSDPGSDKREA